MTAFLRTRSFEWLVRPVTAGSTALIRSGPISLHTAAKAVHTAARSEALRYPRMLGQHTAKLASQAYLQLFIEAELLHSFAKHADMPKRAWKNIQSGEHA